MENSLVGKIELFDCIAVYADIFGSMPVAATHGSPQSTLGHAGSVTAAE